MTTSKFSWYVLRNLRKVWVRVVSFALLAVVTAVVAQAMAPLIPHEWALNIGADAVEDVLNILASSMLAVTTFSLAIATSAYSTAARTATPRATALLQEDPTSQNVLATFLGAFLFSLVGLIALEAGYYGETGLLVLFGVTAITVAAVVIALLRWISHLMVFGRMADTLARVEAAALEALNNRIEMPYLGGRPLHTPVPKSCVAVLSRYTGHIQHIDIGALQSVADEHEVKVWLDALPGSFVHRARPLFYLERDIREDATLDKLHAAFTVGPERNFEQDPRFGLVVLSEIASRALSPAVNDPGTAISVLGRLVNILGHWQEEQSPAIDFPSVFVPPVPPSDMICDAFRPTMRDGATTLEVQIKLQKSLRALAEIAPAAFAGPALDLADEAAERAKDTLKDRDYERLITSTRLARG